MRKQHNYSFIDPRAEAARRNIAHWRQRQQQLRDKCARSGHLFAPESDCCQRCLLPVELMSARNYRQYERKIKAA
jgi:uncharacterized OB-fold protein